MTEDLKWTNERYDELEKLIKLVRTARSLNSANCIVEHIQELEQSATELDSYNRATKQQSFLGFLEQLAIAGISDQIQPNV